MDGFLQQWQVNLSAIDGTIVTLAIAMLFVIGYFAGRKERSTDDFFLGNRRVPMFIAALSLVATEVSAVTITQTPGTGFSENLQYLQFYIGSAASKIFVAFLFIPVFYKHNCTSIYEFLRHRFGPPSQYAGSIFFFITRLLGSGARLYAACLGVAMILDWNIVQSLMLFSAVSVVFIAFGGIKAVVWNGAYQAGMFYIAGAAVIVYLCTQISGGFTEAWNIASQGGRLSMFDFSVDLNKPTSFWAGTASAFFVGMAVFGTDQELVQRLLTVDSRRSSQKAILTTIFAALPVLLMFMFIGTLMFVFFKQNPDSSLPTAAKGVFPYYIGAYLPAGLKGLLLATIILASIDSPLASLSSSFVMDIYRPLVKKNASDRHYLWISRLGVVGFAVVLGLIAYAVSPAQNILWVAFQILGVTGGSLLGIFLLGILTRRGTNRGNIIAMIVSSTVMAVFMFLTNYGPVGLERFFGLTDQLVPSGEKPIVPLAWTWGIVIGTLLTFAIAWVVGRKGNGQCSTLNDQRMAKSQ